MWAPLRREDHTAAGGENKVACCCEFSARCPEDKESTKRKKETTEGVDAGPSRIKGQERGAVAKSKQSKKANVKKKKKNFMFVYFLVCLQLHVSNKVGLRRRSSRRRPIHSGVISKLRR